MAEAYLIWNGPKVDKAMMGEGRDRVTRAAIMLSRYAKEKMSIPYPPSSKPGQYPHKRTGHLRRNVTWEVDPSRPVARWGTNVTYGKELEVYKGRRWMSMANVALSTMIQRILGGKL